MSIEKESIMEKTFHIPSQKDVIGWFKTDFENDESLREVFKSYYFSLFQEDLRRWFEIKNHFGNRALNFIPHADGHFVSHRPNKCSQVPGGEYCFSVACFFTFLIPQLIAKEKGCEEIFYDFAQATGWPILSCGLGGFMSAIQIMKEANIVPYRNEANLYAKLLKAACEYFKEDVQKFLVGGQTSLNQLAYERVCAFAKERNIISNIAQMMNERVDEYINFFTDRGKKGQQDDPYDLYIMRW